MKRIFAIFLVAALVLCGCGQKQQQPQIQQTETPATATSPVLRPQDYFSDRDFDISYEVTKSTLITLNGNTAACAANTVQVDGSIVTITAEGTYLITGTLDDGRLVVNAPKDAKVQLVLEGVNIHSQTSAALYILQADKVFVTTASQSVNTLSNGGSFETIDDNNIDGAIFSKEDVTFNGEGSLVITSPAGNGIVSKDSLTVTCGKYEITCAGHALEGKDDVSIAGGDFLLSAGKDGICAQNSEDATLGCVYIGDGVFDITAEGDGISATAAVQIDEGTFSMLIGGGSENGEAHSSDGWGNMGGMPGGRPGGMGGRPGSMGGMPGSNADAQQDSADSTSMKGIKAGTDLQIAGGSFHINSADDSIHTNGSIAITGGSFSVSSGDDGFHADDKLTIQEGIINITESYEGLEGMHVVVAGGQITLTASDDGLNAAGGNDSSGTAGGRDGIFGGMGGMGNGNGSITISGGTLHVTASGDGMDANGTLVITGGTITVCGPTHGDTATLDYDTSATISGGTFIGTGASGMAQTFSDSAQGVIAVQTGNQSAQTQIALTDSDGKVILSYTPALSFNVVILSAPDIIKGESYTITVGSQSGTFTAS